MKKIRAAFVGIGGYGGVILKEVLEKKDEGIEIVAAADPYAEKSPCLQALRDAGAVWGYDLPYLLTGVYNRHPSSAIRYIRDGRKDIVTFMQELLDQE